MVWQIKMRRPRTSAVALWCVLCSSVLLARVQAQFSITSDGTLELTPAQSVFRDTIVKTVYEQHQLEVRTRLITTRSDYTPPGIDHDLYNYQRPPVDQKGRADYTMNIILDPCRGHDPTCCDGIYGAPEYRVDQTNTVEIPKNSDGKALSVLASRLPDPANSFDDSCLTHVGEIPYRAQLANDEVPSYTTLNTWDKPPLLPGEDFSVCVSYHGARVPFPEYPRCWDYNTTVDATKTCTGVGGTAPNCVMIGYTQTAFVPECGGAFRYTDHCGLWIELHLPGDFEILASVHVAGGLVTGYRLAALPLNYKGDFYKVVCQGDYELWWVQRTRWNFQVEFKKKFHIVAPECDFKILTSKFLNYRETKIPSAEYDAARN